MVRLSQCLHSGCLFTSPHAGSAVVLMINKQRNYLGQGQETLVLESRSPAHC